MRNSVADGATYSAPGANVLWLGVGRFDADSRTIRMQGPSTGPAQRITYAPPVSAMGLDVINGSFSYYSTDGVSVAVFDTSGALVGSFTEDLDSQRGSRNFIGFQHSAGIGFVELRNVFDPVSGSTIDDHGYGGVPVEPGILADECSGIPITGFFTGDQTLEIDTNNCFDTQAPATTSQLQSGSCVTAQNDGWIVWRPNFDGVHTISLCDAANFDTVIAVYEESTVLCQGTLLACNDDFLGCTGNTSEVEFLAFTGNFYLIQIGAFGTGERGTGTLNIFEGSNDLQNDECADAIVLDSSVAVAFDTGESTNSLPSSSCAPIGSDIWYRYTATSAADITVSTCGSSYDTILEAFSGSCGNLISEACNDDFCGRQSQITFAPISGGDLLHSSGWIQ